MISHQTAQNKHMFLVGDLKFCITCSRLLLHMQVKQIKQKYLDSINLNLDIISVFFQM
jgi:hypothetical protein